MIRMAHYVFSLCALTGFTCSFLLFRSYFRIHYRLLFWSAICFFGLALNNVVLFIDIFVIPDIDLAGTRALPGLLGLTALLYGFIEEIL